MLSCSSGFHPASRCAHLDRALLSGRQDELHLELHALRDLDGPRDLLEVVVVRAGATVLLLVPEGIDTSSLPHVFGVLVQEVPERALIPAVLIQPAFFFR